MEVLWNFSGSGVHGLLSVGAASSQHMLGKSEL